MSDHLKFTLIISLLSLFILSCSDASQESVPLEPEFDANAVRVITGQEVRFQETSAGDPTGWNWVFEGGTPATSTEQNPVVTYSEAGNFQVSLTITRDGESESIVKSDFINVFTLFDGADLPEVASCKLDKVFDNDFVDLGFPNNGPLRSTGTIKVQVLFADFPDAAATATTTEVFDLLDPVNQQFFDEMSYGRLNVNLVPNHTWLRLSMPSSHYAEGLRSASGHLAFIQEAVDVADADVDFSDADLVVVMSNPAATAIGFGPAFVSLNDGFSIKADGNSIRTGITSGTDLNFWGGIWLAHEMGHSLGLHDLYAFSGSDAHRFVGGFGMMGLISGESPGFFAYERWLLGWLDDAQMYCHTAGSVAVELQEVATEGGLKAIEIPLSATEALVVESRKRKGFDSSIINDGVLVYVVNSSISRGNGPIQVKPNTDSGTMKQDAPMSIGDVYEYKGVRVEVLNTTSTSDVVLVSM